MGGAEEFMFGSAHQVFGVEIWMGVKAGSLYYQFPARYQEEVWAMMSYGSRTVEVFPDWVWAPP